MMASIEEVLFEAIDAGDTDRVRGLLTAEPSLASARDVERLRELLEADPAAANDPEERGTVGDPATIALVRVALRG